MITTCEHLWIVVLLPLALYKYILLWLCFVALCFPTWVDSCPKSAALTFWEYHAWYWKMSAAWNVSGCSRFWNYIWYKISKEWISLPKGQRVSPRIQRNSTFGTDNAVGWTWHLFCQLSLFVSKCSILFELFWLNAPN